MAKEAYYIKHLQSVRLTQKHSETAIKIYKALGREQTLSEGIRASIEQAAKFLGIKMNP
jgi:hypothetical protein